MQEIKKNPAKAIQAMPLVEGKVNLLTGKHEVTELVHCVLDGAVVIEFLDGKNQPTSTATIDMLKGQDYAFSGNVTINTGKYHLN